jgi:uncharacterized membrane protein YphA (DoxX/SURF4 family)
MLASIFVVGGLDAVRDPESKVKAAESVARPLGRIAPDRSIDTAMLVRLNGAVQVSAGTLLTLGKFRRLAALALIGSVIPTTFAGHRFWEETNDANRAQQRIHFLKNLGLLGGLIHAAADKDGAPSWGWQAKRRGRRVGNAVASTRQASGAATHRTATQLSRAARKANQAAVAAGRAGSDVASTYLSAAAERAGELASKAHEQLPIH